MAHTSGLLVWMHESSHNAFDQSISHSWDQPSNACSDHASNQNDEDPTTPAPHAPSRHKDCSICLGLSLIHLSTPTSAPALVIVQTQLEPCLAQTWVRPDQPCLFDSPARAPPSC